MSKSIFDGWIYEHTQYKRALDSLVEEIDRVLDGATPVIFPLLGDSRAGKTALLADLEAHYASHRSPSGHSRVIQVPMPVAASNEAFAIEVIKKIMGPIPIRGKALEIINQARNAMEAAGVTVLLVDEVNHLVEKRSTERAQTKENRHVADLFKQLVDLSRISVIVSGLPHVARMYSDNDQLENRGLVGAHIRPYAWSVIEDQQQFRDMMGAGLAHMEQHGWQIDVERELVIRYAYLGGGGYIGKARDFLTRIDDVGHTRRNLDLKLLHRAYTDKYRIGAAGGALKLNVIDDVMLNGAHRSALERALRSGRGTQK